MIVVDTNLPVYLLLPSSYKGLAEGVFEKDEDWVAPTLILSEFCNTLVGVVRRGDVAQADAFALA